MKELLEKIPEFARFRDQSLRDKCLACWEEALERGGWSADDLDHIPFTLLIPDCPVSFLTHVRAVTQTALAAAEVLSGFYSGHYDLNREEILAGGLLHDIGKLLEYSREGGVSETGRLLRHPFTGAGLAMKHGLPDSVVHIIASHAGEGDGRYRSPEAVIIHHADFMNFEPLKG